MARSRTGPAGRETVKTRSVALARLAGGGAWPQVRGALIGWDKSLAGTPSRGRRGTIPAHYCVTHVPVGRGKEGSRAPEVLWCGPVKGQFVPEGGTRGTRASLKKFTFFPKFLHHLPGLLEIAHNSLMLCSFFPSVFFSFYSFILQFLLLFVHVYQSFLL